RRGEFATITAGVSYSGGQVLPGNLALTGDHKMIAKRLLADHNVNRLAAFQSEALAAYFPKPYDSMCESLDVLHEHDPSLKPNFKTSAYPTITFNLGPRTVCNPHRNYSNYPSITCAITALGTFDPAEGGELVLYD
ncbi:hypothetical protein BV25DRAFT_1769952, partial [Artomyces pyxidatus]